MCVIIDANVMNDFCNKDHPDFGPVNQWVTGKNKITGKINKGKIVYGGSKYLKELHRKEVKRCLALFTNLKKSGKVVILDQATVDRYEEEIFAKKPISKFDDPHLLAIVSACGCKVLCTNEKRAMTYLNNKDFYLNGAKPPSIYKRKEHIHLLSDDNIAPCCR